MVEKSTLPNGLCRIEALDVFSKDSLQGSNPAAEFELMVASHKQVHVIGHDHVAAYSDIVISLSGSSKINEGSVNSRVGKKTAPIVRAACHEVQRKTQQYAAESGGRFGVFVHGARFAERSGYSTRYRGPAGK
jgi:hypothetical protein